jgi:site-specific recombinase XerD
MNFQALLKDFIGSLNQKGRAEATIIAYKKDLEQLFSFLDSQNISDIKNVDSKHIKQHLKNIQSEQKLTLKSISRKINSIRTFFKFLVESKIIKDNQALDVEHPKLKQHDPRVLSSLEYRAIRDAARLNPKYYTMIELILQTGLRISEIANLKVEDIKFINETKAVLNVAAYSNNSGRTIELNPLAILALQDYFNRFIKDKKRPTDPLFYTKNGGSIIIRNIRASLENIFRKAGIEGITVNDLRNTFIVYQLQNGLPLAKVSEIVGHQKSATTERYLKLLKEEPQRTQSRIIPL